MSKDKESPLDTYYRQIARNDMKERRNMIEKLTVDEIESQCEEMPFMSHEDRWFTRYQLAYDFMQGIAEGLYTGEEAKRIAELISEK